MRRRLALPFCLLLLAAAPPAFAQDELPDEPAPPPPVEQQPEPDTKPQPPPPKSGKLKLKFLNGLSHDGRRYLTKRQRATVRGRVRPYVAGQRVKVRVSRPGDRKVLKKTLRVRKLKGRNVGQFKLRFVAGRQARYKVTGKHRRTAAQEKFVARERARVLDNSAGMGSGGIRVRLLQKGLRRLGYAGHGVDGYYGAATARSVLAFRKVNRLGRTGFAKRGVFKRVFNKRGRFKLKYPNAGKHVEADLSRQVLVLAKGGKAVRTYHTSSGTPSTPTILGHFSFYRKQPGTNSLGMVHSNYFIRGYAIHGYRSVPTYPASHGCLRVPIPDAWSINSWIDIGDDIYVYR